MVVVEDLEQVVGTPGPAPNTGGAGGAGVSNINYRIKCNKSWWWRYR
jgi:hypothetical protein